MRKRWSLVIVMSFLPASAWSAEKINGKEIKLARYAQAFIGAGNVQVDVAPYTIGSKEGAILLFHGIEGEWDGKALNHRIQPASRDGADYVTTYDDRDWNTLVVRKDYEGKPKYELYVPGVKDEIVVAPSDGAAQLTNPRAIFQEYERQQKKEGAPR